MISNKKKKIGKKCEKCDTFFKPEYCLICFRSSERCDTCKLFLITQFFMDEDAIQSLNFNRDITRWISVVNGDPSIFCEKCVLFGLYHHPELDKDMIGLIRIKHLFKLKGFKD